MKRIAISVLCLASLALAPQASACACLCENEGNDPVSVARKEQREIDTADYFFSGYILKRERPFRLQDLFGANPEEAPVKVTIRPVQILKGKAAREITVWEEGPVSCRATLSAQQGFVKVLAYHAEGRLQLSPCTCAETVYNRLADEPR